MADSEQKFGLNKGARLGAIRAQKIKDTSGVALSFQPDFPYQSQPFDPDYFGLSSVPYPDEQ